MPVTDLDGRQARLPRHRRALGRGRQGPPRPDEDLEGRIRKVEQAIRGVEDDQWRRSDPEKSARADDMRRPARAAVADIEADLDKAGRRGQREEGRRGEPTPSRPGSLAREARKAARRVLRLTAATGGSARARLTRRVLVRPLLGTCVPLSRRPTGPPVAPYGRVGGTTG